MRLSNEVLPASSAPLPPPFFRQRHAALTRRLRRWQRLRSRCRRIELRQDRLEAPDVWRQWEAVALDRFAEQFDKDGFIVCVELRHDLIMRRNRSDGVTAPLSLGQALAAQVRLIVWCEACGHRAEPDVAEQVAHHGSGMTVIDWAARYGARIAESDRLSSSLAAHRCRDRAGIMRGARCSAYRVVVAQVHQSAHKNLP
jgi:hypothetical protein